MTDNFTFIHLSDLHFGRIDADVLHRLESFIEDLNPDLVILTGDLTQRARKKQFLEAREFLERLNRPAFVIPGNHDVPLYNLFLRILSPYKKFKRFLKPFMARTYSSPQAAVFGFWTTNRFTVQDGMMNSNEFREAQDFFTHETPGQLRILASHHPLDSIGALSAVSGMKPHLILSGHLHQSEIRPCQERGPYPILLSSGTSTSSRRKEEENSFNVVQKLKEGLRISVFLFDRERGHFDLLRHEEFPV